MISGPLYISRLVACLADAGPQIILQYGNVDITASELLASLYRYARALMTLGIGRGSLVALFAPNCPDAIAIRYAANLIGSGAVYLSNPATIERCGELVAQMAPDLLVLFPPTVALAPTDSSVRIASVGITVAAAAVRLDHLAVEHGSVALPCSAMIRSTWHRWQEPSEQQQANGRAARLQGQHENRAVGRPQPVA